MKTITLIGVGRLGLCTSLCLEKHGFNVLGVDIFPDYVAKLNDKTFVSDEPLVNEMLRASKNFRATTSMDEGLAHSDVYMILVDTPSTGVDRMERTYDTSKVSRILSYINSKKLSNKHVVINCTVFPGFCDRVGRYLLRDCKNVSLSYNPEFIAQGDIIRGFLNPDFLLIGEGSKEAGDALEELYARVCENKPVVCRMSPVSAEISKLANNCFITTKVSFANMIGEMADRTAGADKHAILRAVGADSRIGRRCITPGWGYGGPCFPRDNRALGMYAESVGVRPLIPRATDEFNRLYGTYLAERLLREHAHEPAAQPIVFEHVTYKEPCAVPIIEESHKLLVAQKIAAAGRRALIRDRSAVVEAVEREYGSQFEYEVVEG